MITIIVFIKQKDINIAIFFITKQMGEKLIVSF